MKKIVVLLLLVFACSWCKAQEVKWTSEEQEVLKVVFDMFEGMRKADTTAFSRMFTPNARLLTVMDREQGNEQLRSEDIEKFFQALAKPREVVYDEPLWGIDVKIDGRLAQVWAQYAFYAGDKFSHCGVDVFQLFKDRDNRWKIFSVVDTRHFGEAGCELPDKMYRSVADF